MKSAFLEVIILNNILLALKLVLLDTFFSKRGDSTFISLPLILNIVLNKYDITFYSFKLWRVQNSNFSKQLFWLTLYLLRKELFLTYKCHYFDVIYHLLKFWILELCVSEYLHRFRLHFIYCHIKETFVWIIFSVDLSFR